MQVTRLRSAACNYGLLAVVVGGLIYAWNSVLASDNAIIIYFGRPSDIVSYAATEKWSLLESTFWCAVVAITSLILAGLVATLLLITGLLLGDRLNAIESMAAVLQTLPVLVIVTLSLIVETQTARLLNLSPSASSYCFFPVTVALMFPPLANGAGAIRRIPINLKAMLRLWDCPSLWRIRRVYIPLAIPDILTGVRASSTWAVGATLIAEGLLNGVNGDSKTLGHFLVRPFSSSVLPGRTPAVIVIATLLGFLVYFMFAVIQRYAEKRLRGDVAAAEAEYPLHAIVPDRTSQPV